MLAETAYGKSSVRLVQVSRHGDRHNLKDFTVAIRFEGEYDQSFTDGDNRDVLPTDTMKNTVYALAARHRVEEPEAFGRLLAKHFLERNPRLRRVRIDLTEHQCGRIAVKAREHGQAFVRHGTESRTATVQGESDRFSSLILRPHRRDRVSPCATSRGSTCRCGAGAACRARTIPEP